MLGDRRCRLRRGSSEEEHLAVLDSLQPRMDSHSDTLLKQPRNGSNSSSMLSASMPAQLLLQARPSLGRQERPQRRAPSVPVLACSDHQPRSKAPLGLSLGWLHQRRCLVRLLLPQMICS
jgi:hypothetical protein